MIFGDLVCCVHFVVLLQSCIGALVAPPAVADGPVAGPLLQQPPVGTLLPTNRSSRYTEPTLPGELNDYCRTAQDCRQYAHVCDTRKQTCDCAEGYRPDEMNRACLGAVGRRCLYDSHCITNAYCKGQMICTCKREYGFLTDDNWSCQASSARASSKINPTQLLPLVLVLTWWSVPGIRALL
uniref:EB domain-containing protein n=1 Tax=Anopheles gambiae TaxID=7165 RepID=A0A0E3W282_ANOGA